MSIGRVRSESRPHALAGIVELDDDFAPLGIIVNHDVPVPLAQAGRGRRELLGGDSLSRGNRLLGELMDEVEVHLLHSFAQGIPQDFEPIIEQRHRHRVMAGQHGETLLAFRRGD